MLFFVWGVAAQLETLPVRFLRENLRESWDASSLQRLAKNLPEDLALLEKEYVGGREWKLRFSDGAQGTFQMPPVEKDPDLDSFEKVLWSDPQVVEDLMQRDWKEGGLLFPWADLGIEETEKLTGVEEALHQGRALISKEVAQARSQLFKMVRVYGVALVKSAPAENDTGVRFADATVGAVETTNFGYKFVIKAVNKPHNLAFDSIGLQQHTDYTYCRKVPDIGVFHCLSPADQGGDSLWLDSFAAVEALSDEDKEILAATPVQHVDFSDKWELTAQHPTLEYDSNGRLQRVYFNERTRDSWRHSVPSDDFYAALRRFERLIEEENRMLNTPLVSGDIILFDNSRVMHSRTAFVGERHMEGTYVDWHAATATWQTLQARIRGTPNVYCGNVVGLPNVSASVVVDANLAAASAFKAA